MAFVIIEDYVITLTFKAIVSPLGTEKFLYAIPNVDTHSLCARWLATTIKKRWCALLKININRYTIYTYTDTLKVKGSHTCYSGNSS